MTDEDTLHLDKRRPRYLGGNRRNVSKRQARVSGIAATALVLVMGFVFASPWLDSLNEEWVTCEIDSAVAAEGGWRSSSVWVVEAKTENCRTLTFPGFADEQSARVKVAEISRTQAIDVKLVILSQASAKGFSPFSATVKEYRPGAAGW